MIDRLLSLDRLKNFKSKLLVHDRDVMCVLNLRLRLHPTVTPEQNVCLWQKFGSSEHVPATIENFPKADLQEIEWENGVRSTLDAGFML